MEGQLVDAIGFLLAFTGITLVSIGVYGAVATRNLIRILLSLEVAFNGFLLFILSVVAARSLPATALGVLLVAVVSGEVAVVVALVAAYYRKTGTLDTEVAENVEGGV
ncbi:MAG: NADH-quinone oxidoreductase subunit K [Desulfurococcales archaeon]|nr:NADH-quinone oxidoreductase subunit K [Desulfurococcales archaeon]